MLCIICYHTFAVYNSMLSFLKIWRDFIIFFPTSRGHVGWGSCRPRVSYHLKLWPGTFAEHLDYDPSPKRTNSPSGCGLVGWIPGGNVGTLTSSTLWHRVYGNMYIYIHMYIVYIYITVCNRESSDGFTKDQPLYPSSKCNRIYQIQDSQRTPVHTPSSHQTHLNG